MTGPRFLFVFSLAALALVAVPQLANAKVFRNAYVSFELPDKWDCVLEHTEWVCRTNSPSLDSREAIIILTAKEVGPQDALPAYESHLKAPRTVASRTGQPLQSTVYKVDQRVIFGHPWVDGMHFGSEVPNYYTRYVATIKDKIAVLITFSAYKLHYSKYSADFIRAIESLRVVASRSMMQGQNPSGAGGMPGSELFGGNTQVDLAAMGDGEAPLEGSGGDSDSAKNFMAFALIVGGAGLYLMLKRKKKKR